MYRVAVQLNIGLALKTPLHEKRDNFDPFQDLDRSGCGDVLFYSYLAPAAVPAPDPTSARVTPARRSHSRAGSADLRPGPARPDRPPPPVPGPSQHSRNSSADLNKALGWRAELGLGLLQVCYQ